MTDPKANMSKVENNLRAKLATYPSSARKRKTKLTALEELSEVLFEFRDKGVSLREIAREVSESGLEVSSDTIRRFFASHPRNSGAKPPRPKKQ